MARRRAREFDVGDMLKEEINRDYRDEICVYWNEHYGRAVQPWWHFVCTRATGVRDVRYIPNHEWVSEILPYLNDLSLRAAFRDKNLSDMFLRFPPAPETIVKRIHGAYYTGNYRPLSFTEVERRLATSPEKMIIKPSQTDDGFGVQALVREGNKLFLNDEACTLALLTEQYGDDFIVQERISQHPLLAEIHPSSVNTIRMVTFRWEGELRSLLAFMRFGRGGKLTDNAGTGGICCGIDESGTLNDSAIDSLGTVYALHPTTGYDFSRRILIPSYDKIRDLALDLHRHLLHFDVVSWDFSVDVNGEPIFLEVNFQGVIHVYQLACRQPLFGEFTTDILESVRENRRNLYMV